MGSGRLSRPFSGASAENFMGSAAILWGPAAGVSRLLGPRREILWGRRKFLSSSSLSCRRSGRVFFDAVRPSKSAV